MRSATRQRGDIQGLRAIAVLTVVAAHAGLGLQGGYVGVDVFFVISGFLISQQLFREAATEGRVSLVGFYARRARRILPAATAVLLVTLAASVFLLNRLQALEVSKDALWATFFAANFRFAAQEMDYFAQGQATSPLQHYWSLAVEEQFYVVWPLLLLLAIAWGVRRHGGVSVRPVATLLLLLTCASLAWSLWVTPRDSGAAYFSTAARAWELGVGALIALCGPRLMRRADAGLRGMICLTGLGAIAIACLEFTSLTLVPGYPALLPVAGSAMILLAGVRFERDGEPTERPGLAVRLLSVRPLQRIGDWSYSLYLWHWPVLIVPALYLGRSLSVWESLGLSAAAVVLAATTYHLVEQPFRHGFRGRWSAVALYPVTAGLVLGASLVGSDHVKRELTAEFDNPAVTLVDFGVEKESAIRLPQDRAKAMVQASVLAARSGMGLPGSLAPDLLSLDDDIVPLDDCDYLVDDWKLCPRGAETGSRTMVVLGDSHARMWIPALERIAREQGWQAYYLVRQRCNPAQLENLSADLGEEAAECRDFNEWARSQVAELRPDLVVVANLSRLGSGFPEDTNAELRERYQRLFEDLAAMSRQQVFLASVPESEKHLGECLAGRDVDLGSCSFEPEPRGWEIREQMIAGAQAGGGLVVDPTPWLCWDETCPAVVGSTITYRDTNHLTASYVEEIAPSLARDLIRIVGHAQTRARYPDRKLADMTG